MTRLHYAIGIITALGCFAIALMPQPVFSQECITVDQDKDSAEANGLRWLGLRRVPFTDGVAVFYASPNGLTYLSPVIDGCVFPKAIFAGRFKDETNA